MAIVNANLDIIRGAITIEETTNFTKIKKVEKNAAGQVIKTGEIFVPVSGQITDENGNIVNATVPGAYTTARDAFLTQVDALWSSAASGGKLIP